METVTALLIIIIIIIIITESEFDLRGTVTLLLQDHCTMLPWGVSRLLHIIHNSIAQEKITVKTGKFQVPTIINAGDFNQQWDRQVVPKKLINDWINKQTNNSPSSIGDSERAIPRDMSYTYNLTSCLASISQAT